MSDVPKLFLYQVWIWHDFGIKVSAGGSHFDDVELFRRKNSFRRKILDGYDVAIFCHDDDRRVACRNVSDLFVGQWRHQFRRRYRFVVGTLVAELDNTNQNLSFCSDSDHWYFSAYWRKLLKFD